MVTGWSGSKIASPKACLWIATLVKQSFTSLCVWAALQNIICSRGGSRRWSRLRSSEELQGRNPFHLAVLKAVSSAAPISAPARTQHTFLDVHLSTFWNMGFVWLFQCWWLNIDITVRLPGKGSAVEAHPQSSDFWGRSSLCRSAGCESTGLQLPPPEYQDTCTHHRAWLENTFLKFNS